ncbi:MAG TPA: GEVED domain-containing protein [Bacteroidia bacterium]|nr:GEVED domain-containing protein [Bacteroidia bacterium]
MKNTNTRASGKIEKIFFVFLFFFIAAIGKAQVIKSEGFDNNFAGTAWPNTQLPFGWTYGRLDTDPNNYWDRVNVGVLPTCAPHGGSAGMIRYRSAYIMTPGEQGYLVSRRYDLTARVTASTVSFWIYREATPGNDNIQVYANNNPDPTIGPGTLLQDAVTAFFNVPRPCGTAPIDPCGVWTQHTFQIPAGATFNTNTLYIIIKVTDNGAAGANVYIDDFSIQTYPSPQTLSSIGLDFQNLANVAAPPQNQPNNWIIGCRVTAANEQAQCALGAFTFTHNGSTFPVLDIANSGTGGVKLWWTGGANSFSLTNAIQVGSYAGPAFPVATFNITPVIPAPYNGLLNGNNYFWLTYDIAAGAVSGDYVDADFISANICGATQICGGVGCAIAGGRLIDIAYCVPVYSVGTSALNGSYTNNDYIKRVICTGDPAYPPGIDNDHNDMAVGSFPVGAGMGDACVTSPTMLSTGTVSPFSPHMSDYQKFSMAIVPNMCGPGNSSRTATFLANGSTSYTISIQCGTWYGSNCVAAWIDFNHDGVFNNTMVPAAGGEKICQSGYMNAQTWFGPISFLVPNGNTIGYFGQTTLRVREWYANSSMDACGSGYYGETEDYTVTTRPDCSTLYPGWKIWAGYTDDWNLNTNWCGGVPTINDNALIPGKGTASFNRGPGTYHPVIKSGVLATARKLVMMNDTVEVNSPAGGSLRVCDSLSIGVASVPNTSALIVDSSYIANAVLSNGVNTNSTWMPFRQAFREQKVQLMYKTSELLAQGMIQGDVFDAIIVPIRIRRSTGPYTVSINMYYATNNATYPSFTNVGYTMPVPAAPSNCLAPQASAPVNVFNGPINFSGIPLNGSGNYTITLNGAPFTFTNNPATPLIVEICYSAAASLNDDTWQTQTVGYRSILMLSNLGAYNPPACAWTNTAPNGTNLTFRQSSDLRPNLTFQFHRVYKKFPIQLETNGASNGQWANFGNFIPAKSMVEFKGTSSVIQNIDGTKNTTFYELKINNTGTGHVRLMRPTTTVIDTLRLTSGKLILNSKSILVRNPGTGGIVRTNGGILSETVSPNYGTVEWKIGTTTGSHVFPFVTSGNVYIPFTYSLTTGDVGTVKAATYPTPVSNLPYPANVTNVNDTNNVNNSAYTVDRFWRLINTGPSGKANYKFTYQNTEAPAPIVNGNIRAHRYLFSNNKWKILPYAMTNTLNTPTPATSEVLVTGITGNNLDANIWALADASSPLRMSHSVQNEMGISPNPFTDKIIISLNFIPGVNENISLTLYSVLGELTDETIIPAGLVSNNEHIEWTTGNIKNGIYFLVIKTKNEIRTERVIKMGN